VAAVSKGTLFYYVYNGSRQNRLSVCTTQKRIFADSIVLHVAFTFTFPILLLCHTAHVFQFIVLGHMVPEFKPEAALAFMSKWIADADWLPYNASCTPSQQEKVTVGTAESAELTRVEDEIAKLQARATILRKSALPAGAP